MFYVVTLECWITIIYRPVEIEAQDQEISLHKYCNMVSFIQYSKSQIIFFVFFSPLGRKLFYEIFPPPPNNNKFITILSCAFPMLLLFSSIYSIFYPLCYVSVLEWKLQGVLSYLLLKTRKKNDLIPAFVGFALYTSYKLLKRKVELVRHGWGFLLLRKTWKNGRRNKAGVQSLARHEWFFPSYETVTLLFRAGENPI